MSTHTTPRVDAEPLLISVRDAASALGIGRDQAYRMVREGRLGSVSLGRRLLVPRVELEAFVKRELLKEVP